MQLGVQSGEISVNMETGRLRRSTSNWYVCPPTRLRFRQAEPEPKLTRCLPPVIQLFKKYGNFSSDKEPWKNYGRLNDWNVDLVPKFLMASGELTNILVATDVTKYLEFRQVAGSYVQQGSGSRATVAKVPSDAVEALKSPLMGIFEKRRMKSFIEWVGTFDIKDPATHKGGSPAPFPIFA